MLRNTKSSDRGTFFLLLLSPAIVCLSIYIWKLSGCLGFSHCSLCQMYTPESFLNLGKVDYSKLDRERLMDLNNFKFLINNEVCNGSDPLLLVLVHSYYSNFNKRNTIRQTWGKIRSNDFKLLFLIGEPEYKAFPRDYMVEKNKIHKDLVQGNFRDSYRNLTYKHVMALKWVTEYCWRAKYILKADDDVFINTPLLLKYLKFQPPPTRKLMRCVPIWKASVKRSHRSKWRMTFDEYKFRTYPPYCQGLAILYTTDVIFKLYEKAQHAKYFWIDDVFITGMLASADHITPSTFEPFVLKPDNFQEQLKENKEFPYFIGPWNLKEEKIKELWDMIPHSQKVIT